MQLRIVHMFLLLIIYFATTCPPVLTGVSYPLPRLPVLLQTKLFRPADPEQCTQKDACRCVRNNGQGINLHYLDHGPKPRFNLKIKGLFLQWNPCTGFGSTKDVAVTLKNMLAPVLVLGSATTATFDTLGEYDAINYRGINGSSSQIILKCNTNSKPRIYGFMFDSSKKSVRAVYTGPCRPKPPAPSSLSNGSIILITLLVLIVLYLTIGSAVNIYVRKFDGIQRIPNYEFWSGLPSLVKKSGLNYFLEILNKRHLSQIRSTTVIYTGCRFTADYRYGFIQWNPCTGLTVDKYKDVAVVMGFYQTELMPFGFQKSARFYQLNNTDVISYNATDTISRILLLCDDNIKPTFKFVSEDVNVLVGAYHGPCGSRSEKSEKSLSTGSLILIALFVIIIVYFSMGCVVNTYLRKMSGFERIPNYEFWSGLPSLIKDGFLYTFRRLKPKSAYEEI